MLALKPRLQLYVRLKVNVFCHVTKIKLMRLRCVVNWTKSVQSANVGKFRKHIRIARLYLYFYRLVHTRLCWWELALQVVSKLLRVWYVRQACLNVFWKRALDDGWLLCPVIQPVWSGELSWLFTSIFGPYRVSLNIRIMRMDAWRQRPHIYYW